MVRAPQSRTEPEELTKDERNQLDLAGASKHIAEVHEATTYAEVLYYYTYASTEFPVDRNIISKVVRPGVSGEMILLQVPTVQIFT
jgi:hypothetical protein